MRLKSVEDSRTACSFCPKLCRHACPAAEAEQSEVATPTFKQQVALLAASGKKPLDADRARVLYKCADCHGTVDACRHRIAVSDSLRAARVQAVREGVAPSEIAWLAARFKEHGSPYSADLAARLPSRDVSGNLALLASCTELAHDPEQTRASQAVLERVGANAGVALPNPSCCGYPLLAAGLEDAFKEHATRVAASLAGFERLAVSGPSCAHTLSVRYAEYGIKLRPAVTPLVDLFAEHTDALKSQSSPDPEGLRYAYHDPCFLARRLGRIEEPRAALRAVLGQEPVELGERGHGTRCSGGGGVYPLTNPGPAGACANRVLDLFRETNAHVLITACASSRRRLALADPSLDVRSLAQVLEERTRPS